MAKGMEEISATLFPGSWRGVPLFLNGGNLTGGRKATAKAIFASDEQDVTDTGLRQRSYSVRGYIAAKYERGIFKDSTTEIASDYHAQRAKIIAALEEKGTGVLFHPFQGEVRDLVVMSWSLDESVNEAGIGQLSIEFAKKTVGAIPKEKEGSKEEVLIDGIDLEAALLAYFEDAFGIDLSFIDVIEDAIAGVQAAYAAVEAVVDTIESVAAGINGFATAISSAVADLASLILSPLAIVDSFKNVFTAFDNILPTLGAAFDGLAAGFGFGGNDFTEPVTAAGIQRKKNRDAIDTVINGMFLARAYGAATELDLSSLAKINEVEVILDAQHHAIIRGTQASPEVRESMTKIRESFFNFLADARLTALKVTTETVPPYTPRTLAYQLYDETALTVTLANLNSVQTYELVSGEVQVLSS